MLIFGISAIFFSIGALALIYGLSMHGSDLGLFYFSIGGVTSALGLIAMAVASFSAF